MIPMIARNAKNAPTKPPVLMAGVGCAAAIEWKKVENWYY
jgi:hypothetical protein